MSKWQTFQVRRAVRIHAEAPTMESREPFHLTPAQARLVWWGLRCLGKTITESVAACDEGGDYADDLRCHADAHEFSRNLMARLRCHAESEGPSIIQEGVACV